MEDGRLSMTKAHMAYGQEAKNQPNQKQESPVVAIFVNGSGWNEQSV